MIIVSQDRTRLVNYDNISCIDIYPPSDDTQNFEINAEKVNGEIVELGIYETEERTKEVLKSIAGKYQADKMFECTDSEVQELVANKYKEKGIEPFKFEMPKE